MLSVPRNSFRLSSLFKNQDHLFLSRTTRNIHVPFQSSFHSSPAFWMSTNNKESQGGSSENKGEVKAVQEDDRDPVEKMVNVQKGQYFYDKKAVEKVNDPSFIEKMKKMEEANKEKKVIDLRNYVAAAFLCIGALFIYHLWQTCPYSFVFK